MTLMVERTWADVCDYDALQSECGVRVLVDGTHIALFRTADGELHAIAAIDPFSGASVLSRGIVGTRDSIPFVASPMFKQRFDLRTGTCLDDPTVSVQVFPTKLAGGRVRVGGP